MPGSPAPAAARTAACRAQNPFRCRQQSQPWQSAPQAHASRRSTAPVRSANCADPVTRKPHDAALHVMLCGRPTWRSRWWDGIHPSSSDRCHSMLATMPASNAPTSETCSRGRSRRGWRVRTDHAMWRCYERSGAAGGCCPGCRCFGSTAEPQPMFQVRQ